MCIHKAQKDKHTGSRKEKERDIENSNTFIMVFFRWKSMGQIIAKEHGLELYRFEEPK